MAPSSFDVPGSTAWFLQVPPTWQSQYVIPPAKTPAPDFAE